MMFHVKRDDIQALHPASVIQAAAAVGVTLNVPQAEAIVLHAHEVQRANKTMNLTRITCDRDVLRLHVADSLAWIGVVGEVSGPIVDIGSGAGYPGIPVGIALGTHVVLCESVRKKAAFLAETISMIPFDGEVYPGRAEALARERGAFAQLVVARAVAGLSALVELASPLLVTGGRLIALKGRLEPSELEGALAAARFAGMDLIEVRSYELPRGDEERTSVGFRKCGPPRVHLPRREGLAQHTPLG